MGFSFINNLLMYVITKKVLILFGKCINHIIMSHKILRRVGIFFSFVLTTPVISQPADSVLLRVTYSFYYRPDSTKLDKREDIIILELGRKQSYCYSYYNAQRESLLSQQFNNQKVGGGEKIVANLGLIPRGTSVKYFKSFERKGIDFIDLVGLDWYFVRDSIAEQNWTIFYDTASYLNRQCYKAKSQFRGRNWTAWFATDIPVPAGPLKFGGLPGLILKIEDDNNNFLFLTTAIEKVKIWPMPDKPKLKYFAVGNDKYKKLRLAFLQNPEAFMSSPSMKIEVSSSDIPTQSKGKMKINPLELE
jgi:GLPGLI family protein